MDPIAFPSEIRAFFQQHPGELADENELTKIFKENVTVKDDFVAWTREHPDVVQQTPRLYKALELAEEIPDELSGLGNEFRLAKSVNSLYLRAMDDGSYALIDSLLKPEDGNQVFRIEKDFPDKYVSTALELHEAGLINNNALEYLLSIKNPSLNSVLFEPGVLEVAIPFLKKMDAKDLATILSIQNKHGETPLHDEGKFKLAIPLLKKMDAKDLATILSIQNLNGQTPLHDEGIFILAIPLLEKLDVKDLATILSIQNEFGTTPLFNIGMFKLAISLLEKMNPNDLATILSIQRKFNGSTPLQNIEIFKLAIPLLEKLDAKNLATILSIQDKNGTIPLSEIGIFKLAIPLLEKLDGKNLATIFSIQNKWGATTLFNIRIFKLAIPLLEKLDSKNLATILLIQNLDGETPLQNIEIFKLAIPLLEKLDSNDLEAFLTIKNSTTGQLSIADPELFKLAIPLLEKLEPGNRVTFLSLQDAKGQTLLHNDNLFNEILPMLTGLSADTLNQLFSVQDNEGNTPLHSSLIFNMANSFLSKIDGKVFLIRNNDGFTAEEWGQSKISLKWLIKDKIAVDSKALSEMEYKVNVQKLKQNIDALWDSFVFGNEEGNIPQEYLRLNASGVNKDYTPLEIKTLLDVMVSKMIDKTPWLGTPREEDKEGLHLFYTQMLNNFEQALSLLGKEGSPEKQAGPLIGIAKVELEGRCAAAYQSEIEQAKMLLDSNNEGQGLGLEMNFDKLARASLTGSIENIVRRKYEGGSHAFTQLLYSVGLAASPDPLSIITVEKSQELIIAEWTKGKMVTDLSEMIGRIDREQLQDWFRSTTPEDFGKDFRVKQSEVEYAEKKVIDVVTSHLRQQGIDDTLTESTLIIFQSTQGAALGLSSRPRKFLSDAVFDTLNFATTLDQVNEAQTLLRKENQDDRLQRIGLLEKEDILKEKSTTESLSIDEIALLDSIIVDKKALQQKSIGIEGEFNAFKLNAETRIKLGELLKVQNPQIARKELDIIVAEKKSFDDAIRTLAEEKEIDFSPSETGLPSRGVEYQRRVEYASQFFTANDEAIKLNKRGTVELLVHIGVLESVALMNI